MSKTKPSYEVGQYLTIYCGLNQGCCFRVKGREWRAEEWVGTHKVNSGWFYDTGSYGWRSEGSISTEAHARPSA